MKDIELKDVYGGASWGFWAVVGGATSFILGFIEGLINPMRCGK